MKVGIKELIAEAEKNIDAISVEEAEGTQRWQDRVNPLWKRMCDGCNINRKIDRIVEAAASRGYGIVDTIAAVIDSPLFRED